MMHLFTLLSLTATALLASANPQIIPPLISSALATAPIPSAVAVVVSSAVAAVPPPNTTGAELMPGLDIQPDQLADNILAAIAILNVALTLLNSAYLTDTDVQSVKVGNVDLPIPELSDSSGLGNTIRPLLDLVALLLSTDSA